MEVYFLGVPKKAFLSVRNHPAAPLVTLLGADEPLEGQGAATLREYFLAEYADEEEAEETVEHLVHLVTKGVVPRDKFSLSRYEFAPLMDLFDGSPVFGAIFAGGEELGEAEVLFGEEIAVAAEGLKQLQVEDADLQGAVEWLRELFGRASTEDWAIIRYWC